jgi:hypothetical protein
MHIEFLVEEPSAEALLRGLVPRIVGRETSFEIHVHQGKKDLFAKLPRRLRGYRQWLPADWRIIVLVDEDRQDCRAVKRRMEDAARGARLATPASGKPGALVQVCNRVAIEELEAWYFGDVDALVKAFPSVSRNLAQQAKYRNPDAIGGGTWEALQRVLQKAGYYLAGLNKIDLARTLSPHMDPDRNRSRSFRLLRDTLRRLAS